MQICVYMKKGITFAETKTHHTMKNVSLSELAEAMGRSVWEKGNLRRIYLNDAGYNTKKMSTKAFIWQDENGDFKVSVRIECDSQPFQWIKSQEEEVRESILNSIEIALNPESDEQDDN
jgi:hypothetical protein